MSAIVYDNAPHHSAWWSRIDMREIALALLLLLCYSGFRQVPVWNEYSRYDLVLALVDDGSVRIDPYHENTGDKSFRDGHYYSDKTPGASLLAVPAYVLLRAVSALTGGDLAPEAVMQALAFAAAGIPTVCLALLTLRFLRSLVSPAWALVVTVGYALGTIAFPFATMFFGHAASTAFLFAAFYTLWRTREQGGIASAALAGALAGWAVITELPVALGGMALLAYTAWYNRRRALFFVLGGLPPLLVLLAYNWIAFEHPFRLGYQFTTNFAQQNSRGLLSVELPSLATMLDLLLEPRGLLRLSPWFALAPLGLWAARRRETRAEIMLCAVMCSAFLLYNSGAVNPFGGWTPGPRYLLPALPFAAVLVALAPVAFRPLGSLLIAGSLGLTLIATITMPNAPESVADPLGDLWLPRLLSNDLVTTNAWLRLGLPGIWPLVLLIGAGGIAAVAIVAAAHHNRLARRVPLALCSLLALLIFALILPYDLPGLLSRRGDAVESTPRGAIAIVGSGASRLRTAEHGLVIEPWAQFEARGTPLTQSVVMFEVWSSSGERVWAGWHADVDWRARERKRLNVEWQTADAAPGDYRVSVAVLSADQRITYARLEDVGQVTLARPSVQQASGQ